MITVPPVIVPMALALLITALAVISPRLYRGWKRARTERRIGRGLRRWVLLAPSH